MFHCKQEENDVFILKEYNLVAIGLPQERGNLFGKVGSAVHHRQQDTVYLELGVDLPLYLVYRGEQLFQPFLMPESFSLKFSVRYPSRISH